MPLQTNIPLNFLQSSIILRESSIFQHTLLVLALFIAFLRKLFKEPPIDHPKCIKFRYNHTAILFTSLALSIFNLVMLCCFSYFSLSDERRATLFDVAIRALAWLLHYVYMKYQFNSLKIPILLRIWWGFYLTVSSYCLVIQLLQSDVNFLVLGSDIVYVISGILLCFTGNSVIIYDDARGDLQETLLASHSDSIPDLERKTFSQTVSPYSNAGFLSKMTFSWVGSLISTGYNKRLDLDDVPPLSDRDNVNESFTVFRKYLASSKGSDTQRVSIVQLAKSLMYATWFDILWTAVFGFLNTIAAYAGPFLIDSLVQYLNGRKESKSVGYALVSAFLVAKLVECICEMHLNFRFGVIGLRTKAILKEGIYEKALTLSCISKEGRTSGEVINLMSVDADRIGQFSAFLHDPWIITLKIALALIILFKSVKFASIAALIATVLVMLANYPLSNLSDKYYDNLMKSKDRRMKATTEILKNMRILKLQAWEMKFLSKILELRDIENGWLRKSLNVSAIMASIFWVAPIFVSVVTFSTCTIIGVPLNSGKILSAIATFRILQAAIIDFPVMISKIIQTKVSLSRISLFLSFDELDPNYVEKLPRRSTINDEVAVEIIDGNFSWDLLTPTLTLKDINIKAVCGTSIAICGTIGSGKSTLLSCILGEVPKISGSIRLRGSTAYVPQTPWIQSGKIVDNILFGKVMDVEKYNRVLEACSLKKDLEVLPFGDETIIGERGINLSGGQKQRIQIARALYQDADIYLLDDPFSAVDAHTATHLFKECVLGLLKSKTVLYVTHHLEFLPVADAILVMKEGRIEQVGKYKDILNSGTVFKELVVAHEQALSFLDSIESGTSIDTINEKDTEKKSSKEENDVSGTEDGAMRPPKGQLVEEEEREKGRVGIDVYWKYMTTAYKGFLVPFIVLSQVMFVFLQTLGNYWITWAIPAPQDAKPTVSRNIMLAVYIALALASSLFILLRSMLLVTAGYKTASLLFHKMHVSIFSAPMSFFDANPSARILNRVSTDQSAVDTNTPNRVAGFMFSVISLLGVIVVMSLVVWQVYIIFIPIVALSLWYQQYSIPSARELIRLVGVSTTPVIHHFTESISGVSVIRSFGQESRFCETSESLINGYLRPNFYRAAAIQWLNFRLDMLSSLVFGCSLIYSISIPLESLNPVIAGLAVTYALNLNSLQSRVIMNFSWMENRIISVERILQYTGISSEGSLVVQNHRPDPSWPSHGHVDVQHLQVRYASQLPLVLKGITCSFPGGKKSGIVGRTGCGKSTLIQALFRIVEPAAGHIIIDGTNISSIGLHDLRSRLSIIPQDPTMFHGTIRTNLDPLEVYTDEQIWEALDKCQLGDLVRNLGGKLDSTVSENGENWSVGQRQLICLGRALVKKSKVLVLDEATASMDTTTDKLIQQTLTKHFSDSTVITVAHRITSVIDSDQVIVLSHGVVEESDTPSRLLANQSSSFSKLVAEYTTRSKSQETDLTKAKLV